MWLILLAISVTIVAGDHVVNPDCELPTHLACRSDELQLHFPNSEAELDAYCNGVMDYMMCGISVEERCQFHPESILEARQVLAIVHKVCDKNGQLNKDIVESLECMSGFIGNKTGAPCFQSQPDEVKFQNYEKALVDQGVIQSGGINERCFKYVHSISCMVLKLEDTCGEVAKNAVIEIAVDFSSILFMECEEGIGVLLPAVVSLQKLEEANEPELEATTVADDACNVPMNETCIPDMDALIFPETQEQLEKSCKAEIDFMDCTIQTEEKCQFNPETLPYLTKFLNLTRDICSKGNPLYEGLEANIGCSKPLIFQHFGECQNVTLDVKKFETLATSMQNEGMSVFTDDENDREECLNGLNTFACSVNKLEEECGGDALQTFVAIVYARTENMIKKCNWDIYKHLHDVTRLVKAQEKLEEEVERLIGGVENIWK